MAVKEQSEEKVLVIGLDSATFDIIDPLIKKNKLPNISQLINKGIRSKLRSTIPPLSPNAWTSFATGKNAGKHGIFSFSEQKRESYEIQFVNSRTRGANPIWSILSDEGRRVAVINMPITYPPDAVNGFMISGMDTPGIDCPFTYPADLKNVLIDKFDYEIDYSFLGSLDKRTGKKILENLFRVEKKRIDTAKYLMSKTEWDFFFIVLVALDRVQHFFWHCMEPFHPRYHQEGAEQFRSAIFDIYEKIDGLVGTLIEDLDEQVSIIIMSDHGAGPFDNSVPYLNLNEWLYQNGYLGLKDLGMVRSSVLTKMTDILRKNLSFGMKQRFKMIFPKVKERVQSHAYFSQISWPNTMAFASYDEFMARGIRINLEKREPEGIVKTGIKYENLRDELIQALENLKHPVTNEPIVENVYRREELYNGDFLEKMPDLVVEWSDQAFFSGNREKKGEKRIRKEKFQLTRIMRSGEHRSDGIFIARGRNLKKKEEIPSIHIMDLTPTILYLLGHSVPDDMDGKVATQIFKEEFFTNRSVKFRKAKEWQRPSIRETYSEDQEKRIKEKLKGLGYIEK